LDLTNATFNEVMKTQDAVMGLLGNLQHHDAITGTAAQKVVDSFMEKARAGKAKIDE
jgi:hypothetical protein